MVERPISGRQDAPITRAQVESLLEAVLGQPRKTPRDVHTELVMVDRQRALLVQIFERRPNTMFSIEDVEMVLDALEEYGECEIPAALFGEDAGDRDFSAPPLTAEELRQVVALCALRSGTDPQSFLLDINRRLIKEQMRLRSDLLRFSQPARQEPPTARRPRTDRARLRRRVAI